MKIADLQAALLAAATGRDEPDAKLLEWVRSDGLASASERVAAYRANVRGGHLVALEQAYHVLREVLGPRYWRQLLEREVPVFASRSPDLNGYGEFMPALLCSAQERRPELRDMPYLEDLATLEWHVHLARLAADDPVFDWEAFVSLPDERQSQARLLRSNAIALLSLDHPVDTIWRSHRGIDAPADDDASNVYCCVHRDGHFDVDVARVSQREFEVLQALSRKCVAELAGADSAALARKIFSWIRRGWIVGFEFDD